MNILAHFFLATYFFEARITLSHYIYFNIVFILRAPNFYSIKKLTQLLCALKSYTQHQHFLSFFKIYFIFTNYYNMALLKLNILNVYTFFKIKLNTFITNSILVYIQYYL